MPPKRPQETPVDRLKRRITDRIDADRDKPRGYRRTQVGLAEKMGISKATLNELLNGPSAQRGLLARLDLIADYFGITPSLLVHRNDTSLIELRADEYRLITHWRNMPADVQQTVMDAFDYFVGLLPEEREARRIWRMWRALGSRDRAELEELLREAYRTRRIGGSKTSSARDVSASTETKAARAHQK